jgi:transposase InsO family protein
MDVPILTPDQRVRVFVSSTLEELAPRTGGGAPRGPAAAAGSGDVRARGAAASAASAVPGVPNDVARGLAPRHDWGPQYRSAHFTGSLAWLGISDDPAFLGEPETNGCAERWIRTLKDQCLWVQLHDTFDKLRQAVASFVRTYNTQWLIQRHGHRTPKEAYQAAQSASPA